MKIAIITDTHFGSRTDNAKILDHQHKFFEDTFFPYIDEHNIDTVLHLGDLFDRRKQLNTATSKRCKQFFFDQIDNRGIDFHYILGNHDTHHKSTNFINTPEEVLASYNFNGYHGTPEIVNIGGLDIALVPWISPDIYDQAVEFIQTTKASVVMGHFDIQGFQMYKGSISQHGFNKSMFDRFHLVLSGHYHHKSNDRNIHYLGSPYQMNWADYGDKRGFHVLDTDTLDMEFIPNPISLFQKIVYDDSDLTVEDVDRIDSNTLDGAFIKLVVDKKTNPAVLEALESKLSGANLADLKIDDTSSDIKLSEEVDLTDVEDLIDFIDVCVDSNNQHADDVRQLLRKIYFEVQV